MRTEWAIIRVHQFNFCLKHSDNDFKEYNVGMGDGDVIVSKFDLGAKAYFMIGLLRVYVDCLPDRQFHRLCYALVAKTEPFLTVKQVVLRYFMDIEGAFDNTNREAIRKVLID